MGRFFFRRLNLELSVDQGQEELGHMIQAAETPMVTSVLGLQAVEMPLVTCALRLRVVETPMVTSVLECRQWRWPCWSVCWYCGQERYPSDQRAGNAGSSTVQGWQVLLLLKGLWEDLEISRKASLLQFMKNIQPQTGVHSPPATCILSEIVFLFMCSILINAFEGWGRKNDHHLDRHCLKNSLIQLLWWGWLDLFLLFRFVCLIDFYYKYSCSGWEAWELNKQTKKHTNRLS